MLLSQIGFTFLYFELNFRQIASTIGYNIFVLLRIYQFIIVVDVIKAKLEILLEQVSSMDIKGKIGWNSEIQKLVEIKHSYEEILRTVTLFNE